jgi:hypothetical protein
MPDEGIEQSGSFSYYKRQFVNFLQKAGNVQFSPMDRI